MYNTRKTIEFYKDKLQETGVFSGGVFVGEPMDLPTPPAIAIFLGPEWLFNSLSLADADLNKMINIRIYISPFPPTESEFLLDELVSSTLQMLASNYSNEDTNLLQIDFINVRVTFGYFRIEEGALRIADINVPLITTGDIVWQ